MSDRMGSLLVWVLFLSVFGLAVHDDQAKSIKKEVSDDTSIEYLQHMYDEYNLAYFSSKLPKKVLISFNEHDPDFAASVECDQQGENCGIMFNPHYNAAPKFADLNLQHEMCHIEVWAKAGPDHGKEWQTCMLRLDAQGSNRLVLIDGYDGH